MKRVSVWYADSYDQDDSRMVGDPAQPPARQARGADPAVKMRFQTLGKVSGMFLLLLVMGPAFAERESVAVTKVGSCPAGYSTSGDYCQPGPSARFALEKTGPCPSGYSTSGAYCLASTMTTHNALPRTGPCPAGYSSSGDYCLRQPAAGPSMTSSVDLIARPVSKIGACPSGFSTSGDFCQPGPVARFAVAKVGSCPFGYATSGAYCLANAQTTRHAMAKSGTCPSGYSTSGAYCLQN